MNGRPDEPMGGPVIRAAGPDRDLVEARLAARLASALTEASDRLPADVRERLRFAREQALARRATRPATMQVGRTAGGSLVLGWLGVWWPRVGVLLPLLVLAAGLWLVDDARQRQDQRVVAAIDVALLSDDLPPEAYADPGFVEFLKLQRP